MADPPDQQQQQQAGDQDIVINDGDQQNEIDALRTVRLPWPSMIRDNIDMWFLQIDHWFTVNRITSDNTRFSTVVAALDGNLLQQIYETVRNPPSTEKYKALKNAVIRNFTESEQRRAQQFVSGLQLGDKKPSHLLNDLRRIGGENQDEKLLKILWLNRLPVQVQTCLAACTSPLNDLAQLADSVMETFRVSESFNINTVQLESNQTPTRNIAVASSSRIATTNTDDDRLSMLTTQIEKLTREIGRLQNVNSSSQRSRSSERSSSQQRSRSTTPMNENDSRCWYHRTYGNNARKCREPCDYPKN